MPTYEFACQDCGNRVEVFQRIGEEPLSICEVCGGPMRKVFHPAGIVFRGSGFYKTDSRSGSGTKKGSSSDGGEKKTDSKKDSDSKRSDSKKDSDSRPAASGGGDGGGSKPKTDTKKKETA